MQNPPPDPQSYGSPYNAPPASPPPGGKTSLGLDANVAAMLCYLTMIVCGLGIVLSLVFFLAEKTNRFVRFHAMQALLLAGAGVIISIVLAILGGVLSYVHLGFVAGLLRWVLSLALLALWILLAIKAYKGELYKAPVVGDVAENIVNK